MKCITLGLVSLLSFTSARAGFYSFTQITSTAYPFLGVAGINNNGDLVGTAYDTANRPVAFRYSGSTLLIYPSPGPSHSTWGYGINNAGTIVGQCDRTGSAYGSADHVFYATTTGSAIDFDGDFTRESAAVAVNNNGFVVGWLSPHNTPFTQQAFLGATNGWIMPLGPTLGSSFVAAGVNDSFVIVGNGAFGGETYNATTGVISYMGWALGNDWTNQAAAVNASGMVAGRTHSQGYIWSNGTATIFGSNILSVSAMNNNGDVVGALTNGHSFVYIHATGEFLDLNNCIASSISSTWNLCSAVGINDNGVITGESRRPSVPTEYPTWGPFVSVPYKLTPFIVRPIPGPVLNPNPVVKG